MADRPTRVGVNDASFIPTSPATEGTAQAIAGFVTSHYDYVGATYNVDNDVFLYKHGGSGGISVATITVQYSDATKTVISSIAKT